MMKTDDINDQAITKDKIRDGNITAEKLADGAVSTDKLPDGAIKTPKIADGNITTSKLAEASVVTSKIADQNITKEKIADHSVDNSKLSPEAVTYDKLKDKSVITEKLNDRAVTTEKIEEKAITNAKIGDSAVDGRVISEASVEKKHLANNSVATEKLQDSSVTSDKIHTNAVTEEKIEDSAISNPKLADNSVGTSKIKDGNVTNEKVANNTLTIDKFDPELRKSIQAATGLPENLVEVIQDVDVDVKSLHSKDEDLQSQIADKQQQITANDKDIESLQNRSTQMEQSINNIAVTGGASVANTVTYSNTASGLVSINAQGAIDELAAKNATKAEKEEVTAELEKKFDKESILQESGDSEDKVMSQKATTSAIADETTRAKAAEEAIIFDVSVNNNGAVFESLQAILSSSNLSTLIPTSVRHGGMTIRFIQGSEQSSDNKYVQYRLIDTSFSTTPSDWQGVDDEPITGSNNIVKSGYFNDKFGGTISNQYNVTIYGLNLSVHGSWKKGDTLAINLYGATVFSYQLNIYFEDGTDQVYYKNVGDYTYFDLPKDCNRVRAYANPSETIKNLGMYTLTVENTGSIAIEQKEILSYGIIDVDRLAPLDSGSYSLSSAATVVNQKGLFKEGCIISFKNGAIKEVWQSVGPNYSTYYWRKLSSWERKEGILDLFLIQGRVTTYHTFDNDYDYKRTDYLELDGSDITGVLSGSGYSTPIAFYNENYTYIGSYSGTISAGTMPFTVPASSIPSNAKYVIFTNNLYDGHVFDGLAYINSGVKLPNILKNEKGDILSLNPKDTVGNLVIQAKRPLANWHRQGTYNAILSMMVFTDLHADKVNLERIIKFDDEYSSYIDDYIQLGDIVDDNYGNDFSFFSNLPFSKKIMSAIGNHDTRANYDERETADNQWTLHAGIDAYNKYFAPFSSYWLANVVQPTNAASNGLCYYYKDYTSSKLRLIVLDCMKYTTEQLTWFANSLTNAISLGYSVIVAQHSNFGGYIPLGDFSSLDDSYADKSGGGDGNVDDYLNAVDTFINNGGTFICWLSGHMHVDCSGWIAYHNNQLAFVFECAKCSGAYSDGDRVLGEKSQDSFNIISVDTNANLVKVVRVGNDCDRYLRSRKSIVVNYLTKEIVSSM